MNYSWKGFLTEDELKRALAEDGSSTSTYITPESYYPSG